MTVGAITIVLRVEMGVFRRGLEVSHAVCGSQASQAAVLAMSNPRSGT